MIVPSELEFHLICFGGVFYFYFLLLLLSSSSSTSVFVDSIKYSETDDIWIDLCVCFFTVFQCFGIKTSFTDTFLLKSFCLFEHSLFRLRCVFFFSIYLFIHVVFYARFALKNLTNTKLSLCQKHINTHPHEMYLCRSRMWYMHAMNAWTDAIQTYRLLSLSSSALPSLRISLAVCVCLFVYLLLFIWILSCNTSAMGGIGVATHCNHSGCYQLKNCEKPKKRSSDECVFVRFNHV